MPCIKIYVWRHIPPFFQLSLSPNQSSSTHSLSFLHSSCFQLEAQFYIVSHTMYDEKKPFKPWDSPVLDRRLPVARRYSNALVTSAVMLNALIKLSAFMLISAFSVLFSKTNLTDCSQFSSLSYGLKVRGLNWKLENRDSNYECLICYACYRSLLKSAGWTTFSKVEAFWPYFLHWLYCI